MAAPLARVPATVAAGNNQYTMGEPDVTNAHRRQQTQPHTSRTLETCFNGLNILDGINTRTNDESPPGARAGALTVITGGEHA